MVENKPFKKSQLFVARVVVNHRMAISNAPAYPATLPSYYL